MEPVLLERKKRNYSFFFIFISKKSLSFLFDTESTLGNDSASFEVGGIGMAGLRAWDFRPPTVFSL